MNRNRQHGRHFLSFVLVGLAFSSGAQAVRPSKKLTSAQLPDLIVSSVTMSPANPKNGDQVIFSAVVKNQGIGATPANVVIGIAFYIDGQEVSWSGSSGASLAAGASETLTADGGPNSNMASWTATGGNHTLMAYVNDVRRFTESNYNNNTLAETISVASTAQPTPTSEIQVSESAKTNSKSSHFIKSLGPACNTPTTTCLGEG